MMNIFSFVILLFFMWFILYFIWDSEIYLSNEADETDNSDTFSTYKENNKNNSNKKKVSSHISTPHPKGKLSDIIMDDNMFKLDASHMLSKHLKEDDIEKLTTAIESPSISGISSEMSNISPLNDELLQKKVSDSEVIFVTFSVLV